jgi:subtilisin family serine protease
MRQFVLAAFALLAFASGEAVAIPSPAGPPGAAMAAASLQPGGEADHVIVQFDVPLRAQRDDGRAPSLEEQGFRRLPVPAGMSAADFVTLLAADPAVRAAEVDAPVYAAAVPDDPFYAANQAAYMNLINAPAAWDIATGAGHPVIVAVLDSGIDIRHPEFSGRLWENVLDASLNGIDDDGNGCVDDRYGCRTVEVTAANRALCGYDSSAQTGAILDDHGAAGTGTDSHGTLVAGIIGAAGNNGTGIAGVSWNVRLMAVKVLDCGSGASGLPAGTTWSVAKGIDYARLNGASIINLSLTTAEDTPTLQAAVAAAERDGVIIVAAAGNHRPGAGTVSPGYPAAYTQFGNVVAVAASDLNGNWATFSNYGPAIDIAAPGVGIAGTRRTDLGLSQPYGADPQGGTSFAAPLVTGVLALMMARNPDLAVQEYVNALKQTAAPAPPAPHGQEWAGAGILDAGRALARLSMSLNGPALQDFIDAPAGTDIRAFIGGQECGRTSTTTLARASIYVLRVRSAAEQPGCGQPGAEVRFQVGGMAVQEPVRWGGRDEVISFRGYALSAVSPPPGPFVVQALGNGWSNIAQIDAGGTLPGALAGLAAPWNAVLRWEPSPDQPFGGVFRRYIKGAADYVNDIGVLNRYDAFWIEAERVNAATANPNPAPGRTVELRRGWNNIVYTGANRAVADALADIAGKYTQVLYYDNLTGAWKSHLPGQSRFLNDFGGLFQFRTYFILMAEDGQLTMR